MTKCCGEEMIEVFYNDDIRRFRCMICDKVFKEPHAEYLNIDDDLINMFKK